MVGRIDSVRGAKALFCIAVAVGNTIASSKDDGKLGFYPFLPVPESMMPSAYTQDGQWIFAHAQKRDLPVTIFRVNVQTGQAEPWKQVSPTDREGITDLAHILVARDGKSYFYSHHRILSELFILDGWENR
jgi:hypothetical protein